ncbi:hypothetical protein BX265_0981 [Streptomyces sp. TLI_235]|nr:hypothetical protein [Streptomyces sp. TLI_235]PBC76274.1 hypothetical protein BX265_0981 [Streptomyces sp. TLI_235]
MTEHTTDDRATSCCTSGPAETHRIQRPAAATPCCGTAQDAAAAGTCCAPDAKREATAAGAGCC